MLRSASALLLLVFAACAERPLTPAAPDLRFDTRALTLPPAAVNGVSSAELVLENHGRADGSIALSTEPPYAVVPESLSIPAGAKAVVRVRFQPTAEGEALGALHVTGDAAAEIGLRAVGVVCRNAHPCRASLWNEETFECEEVPLSDGSACSSACVLEGVCGGGLCLGRSPDCDDANACTLDGCDEGGACLHVAQRCAGNDDPCLAPSCDPQRGCTLDPVADGTPCGATTCSVSRVCIAGVCEARPAQDGTPCGLGSPCQAAGVCAGGECQRPPASALEPDWFHEAQGIPVGLVADADSNAYWFEEAANVPDWSSFFGPARVPRGHLVSVTRDGAIRFREPVFRPEAHEAVPQERPAEWQNAVGAFGLVSSDGYVLELRDRATGRLLWSRDLVELLAQRFGLEVMWLALDPRGLAVSASHIHLGLHARTPPTERGEFHAWLLSFRPDGRLAWLRERTYGSPIVLDAEGNVHGVTSALLGPVGSHALTRWSPNGEVLWQNTSRDHPVASVDGHLFAGVPGSFRWLDAETGAPVAPELARESCGFHPKRVSANGWAALVGPLTCCGYDCVSSYVPERLHVTQRGGECDGWERRSLYFSSPLLTSSDLLVLRETLYEPGWSEPRGSFFGLDRHGDEVFRCPSAFGEGVLSDRVIYAFTGGGIGAFPMPFSAAERGWSHERGGPGSTGAAGR